MKRQKVLLVLLMVFLTGATAQAQQPQPAPAPQQPGGAPTGQPGNGEVLNLIPVLAAVRLPAQRGAGGLSIGGQRGAGGLGPGTNPPNQANADPNNPGLVILDNNVIRRIQINPGLGLATPFGQTLTIQGGAWWTNTALLTRLGLTDDQKLKIERVYENHRQNLVSSKDVLEKEEAQLSRLLEADPLDRTASVAQIYKVVQARGEMEKTNSLMTFEMREILTRAQWTQLQAQPGPLYLNLNQGLGAPGVRGGGRGTPFGVVPPPAVPAPVPAPPGTGGQRGGRGQ